MLFATPVKAGPAGVLKLLLGSVSAYAPCYHATLHNRLKYTRMDATLHRSSCSSALITALLLSGCQATAPAPVSQATPAVDLEGLTVFNQALAEAPLPNSIIRDGDRVTYMVVSPAAQALGFMARFDADCVRPQAQMAYKVKGGMKRFSIDPRGKTEESWQLPARQMPQYLQSAQLKQVCAQTAPPDWRMLTAPEQGDWQLLDRASLKAQRDEVTFWSARVLPSEARVPRADLLYGQIQQRWLANCSLQQLTELSSFYIDKEHRVLGGRVNTEPETIALKSLPVEERPLFEAACGSPKSQGQYKPYERRIQSSFELPAPTPAAPVLKSIEALNMPEPQKSIQHLRMARQDSTPKQEVYDYTYLPGETGKQLTRRSKDERRQRLTVSFRGLIELADSHFRRSKDGFSFRDNTLNILTFEGDWANMPVGAILQYSTERPPYYPRAGNRRPVVEQFSCEVQSQKPASAYHPALIGNAKELSCKRIDYASEKITVHAYLETYGMFVATELRGPRSHVRWTIEAVE